MSDVTQLLEEAARGDRHAADRLLPLVYDELRRLAAGYLDREQPGHTLEATALVHKGVSTARWQGRCCTLAGPRSFRRHGGHRHAPHPDRQRLAPAAGKTGRRSGGVSVEEAGKQLGLSRASAYRVRAIARA